MFWFIYKMKLIILGTVELFVDNDIVYDIIKEVLNGEKSSFKNGKVNYSKSERC